MSSRSPTWVRSILDGHINPVLHASWEGGGHYPAIDVS